jgi:glycosyltransferase involved in cell wall biosynthesis
MKDKFSFYPLVSVIIPMYNVEKYIAQCINSIINQSYNNLEIILINDGSHDYSGDIANDFSKKDKRIKVVHTINRGVSEARNLGIETAKGEYIIFVDSDDFLAPEYVEYMLSIAEKTGANFVMSKNCFRFPGDELQIKNDMVQNCTPAEAAAALLYPGHIEIGCWNKMFNRDFLIKSKITFPVNFFMGEGLNFIIAAAQLTNCVGVGQKRVYYYRKDNPNSATTVLNVPKYINALDAIDNIENKAIAKSVQFKEALKLHRYLTVFFAMNAILLTDSVKDYEVEYKSYLSLIRKNILCLLNADVWIILKIRICFYCVNPKIASKMINLLNSIKN